MTNEGIPNLPNALQQAEQTVNQAALHMPSSGGEATPPVEQLAEARTARVEAMQGHAGNTAMHAVSDDPFRLMRNPSQWARRREHDLHDASPHLDGAHG